MNTSQVERQMFILSLLSEHSSGYTVDEIMTNLHRVGIDVSRKTIERDLDSITENFFVYEERRNRKTYYIANKYSIKNISFSLSELLSLYFTREVLKSYTSIDVGLTAVSFLNRFISTAPDVYKNYIATLNGMLKVNISDIYPEKEINTEFLKVIKDAIAGKKSIIIDYYSFNSNEITHRQIDPYLLEINEGCWHLVGFCHLRNSIRDFRVSRIKSINLLNNTFIRPDNFYENYKEGRFSKLTGDEKVKIKIKFSKNAARYIKEYEVRKADNIIDLDDGSIIFEKYAAMTPEILKWVLGFGKDAEILEPIKLREDVKEEVSGLYNIYGINMEVADGNE